MHMSGESEFFGDMEAVIHISTAYRARVERMRMSHVHEHGSRASTTPNIDDFT